MYQSTPLDKAANKLELRPERHAVFADLVLHHLRNTAAVNPQDAYGSPAHLDSTTLSFLAIYGGQIWTAYSPMRGHLTTSSTVPLLNRGLFHAEHTQLKKDPRKKWKDANGDREPKDTEEVLGSRLGKLMRGYLEVLVRTANSKATGVRDTGQCGAEVSEQDLLNAVIFKPTREKDEKEDAPRS